MKYRLNEPYLKGKEKEYVLDVLESGWLSSKGEHTLVFEQKFAEMVGVKYALAVQSGTAALHTALLALGVSNGDEVIIPNYTCAANVTSVLQCGATPVILDIEKETFGLDIDKLKDYLRANKPKVVMVVHIYGFPARDTEKIADLCKKENILFLEDCAEAHGAKIKDKIVGTFSDIAIFSVRSEKMIGVGEGGMIVSNNKELMEKALYWASRASPCRGTKYPYWYQYYYSGVGMNYLMPHLLGAVGRAQIENFSEILSRKRKVGEKYQEIFKNHPKITLQKKIEGANPSYWLNIILFHDKSKEEIRKLGEKLIATGIEIRPPFWPLGDQEIFRKYAYGSQENGNSVFDKGIVLPSSVFLAEDNCKGVIEISEIVSKIIQE